MANEGYRVSALVLNLMELIIQNQQEFKFYFKGLVGFYDPPKANIQEVLKHFHKAEFR
jgi:Ca2+-transporting ATPase